MKRLALAVILGTVLGSGSAGEYAFRFFFAAEGVEDNDPLNDLKPKELNPAISACAGPQRLYVWGQIIDPPGERSKYISVGYNVRTTGTAEIVAARTWNYTNILQRWAVTNAGQIVDGELENVRLAANPSVNFGVASDAGPGDLDSQFDPETISTLLGWIEVQGVGELRFEVGDIGIIRTGGGPTVVWFGFGDEVAEGNPIADANAVPCGDANCDGVLDGADIDPFFVAIGDPQAYEQQYPECDLDAGDANRDGNVDGADIDVFFECLFQGSCP